MNPKLREKTRESLCAVLPITLIVLAISVMIVPMELGPVALFLVGAAMLVVGMGLFQLGAEMAMTPLGEGVGAQLERTRSVVPVLLIAFAMGALITIAEPDLQVLSEQVPAIPNRVLIFSVAAGVGVFLALAVLRILKRWPLPQMLMALYGAMIVLSFLVPKNFLAVAFDAGGVTTGPITVPFIMALGVGLASGRSDRNAASDSFGLIALSSVGPVLAVMLLGCFFRPQDAQSGSASMQQVLTTRDVAQAFVSGLPQFAKEVMLSLLPIAAMLAAFQLLTHRYSRRQRLRVLIGLGYTCLGLVLFLCGVNVGFGPVGTLLGRSLAQEPTRWLLVPLGMLIGFFIVKAEPAIQVLNHQIQSVTNGAVSARAMNLCLSVGVCISVGLAMLRLILHIPIAAILIPGYLIALALPRLVPPLFVGIAFDSGGVASGPMTTAFLLPLSIGACETLGGNVMTEAFGVVALVALTPIVAVQLMGLLYQVRLERRLRHARAPVRPGMDVRDVIVELEEEAA